MTHLKLQKLQKGDYPISTSPKCQYAAEYKYHLFVIFAVLDVSLAVNLCINCSFLHLYLQFYYISARERPSALSHYAQSQYIVGMTARLEFDITLKTTKQNRIVCTSKSEAEVTNNKKTALEYY